MAHPTYKVGDTVAVSLADGKGGFTLSSSAKVERIALRNDGTVDTVFVRLTGFPEGPYAVGLRLPLTPDKVEAISTPSVYQHEDGLVRFGG